VELILWNKRNKSFGTKKLITIYYEYRKTYMKEYKKKGTHIQKNIKRKEHMHGKNIKRKEHIRKTSMKRYITNIEKHI
jgi:hypothetical protein